MAGAPWYGSDVKMLKAIFGTIGASLLSCYAMFNLSGIINPPRIPAPDVEE